MQQRRDRRADSAWRRRGVRSLLLGVVAVAFGLVLGPVPAAEAESVGAPPPEPQAKPGDGWVKCPRVNVAANVTTAFKGGKVHCTYWTKAGGMIETKTVSPRAGYAFTACMSDNAQYKKNQKRYSSRMYCSYSKTPAEMVAQTWGWSTNNKASKIYFGTRTVRGKATEKLGVCRASYKKGKYIGRVWRGKCYFPYKKKERVLGADGVEYLVLKRSYGVPVAGRVNKKRPTAWDVVLNPQAPPPVQQRVCQVHTGRGNKYTHALGLRKNVTLKLPGRWLMGDLCVTAAKGKTVVAPADKMLTMR